MCMQNVDMQVFSPTAFVFRSTGSKEPPNFPLPAPLPVKHSSPAVTSPTPVKRSRRNKDGDSVSGGSNNSGKVL